MITTLQKNNEVKYISSVSLYGGRWGYLEVTIVNGVFKHSEARGCILPIFGSKVFKEEKKGSANALRGSELDTLREK